MHVRLRRAKEKKLFLAQNQKRIARILYAERVRGWQWRNAQRLRGVSSDTLGLWFDRV